MASSDGPSADAWLANTAMLADNLTMLPRQTDEQLVRLYRSAKVYVSTSTYEGWHAPPMEHYLRGGHLVLPRIPPYTEVYPDAAVFYYRPGSVDDMGRALVEAVEAPLRPPAEAVRKMVSLEGVGRKLLEAYGV